MDKLMRLPKVMDVTGLARPTVYRMMGEGTFPRNVVLAKRAIAWRESEIEDWINSRVVRSGNARQK